MFSHVILGAKEVQQSRKFYDAALGALGVAPGTMDDKGRCFYRTKTGVFGITLPINGEPCSHGNGSTIGFAAESADAVNAWHAAGAANGGTPIEEPPGIRSNASMKLYLAYLRDPAGNKVCAMYRLPREA